MTKFQSYILTGVVVIIAVVMGCLKYWDNVINPWTRDGQVAAQIVLIAPRVTGTVDKVLVSDNQYVKKGDLLFTIDDEIYKAKLELAEANLQKTGNELVALDKDVEIFSQKLKVADEKVTEMEAILQKAQALFEDSTTDFNRKKKLLKAGVIAQKEFDTSNADYEVSSARLKDANTKVMQSKYELEMAKDNLAKAKAERGKQGKDNATLRLAEAQLELAQLNMGYTRVSAPADGYISNLQLRAGSQAIADKAVFALIDGESFWVYGFFQEDEIKDIVIGDKAVVTLMSYPDIPLKAEVESIGWGIARMNGSPGNNLLANVKPNFEWIRLAQRIPVRVVIKELPASVRLRVGTTASVMVKTGTAE